MDLLHTAFGSASEPFSDDDELLDAVTAWARAALLARVDPERAAPPLRWLLRLEISTRAVTSGPAAQRAGLLALRLENSMGLHRDDLLLLLALTVMSEDEVFTALRRRTINDDPQLTVGLLISLLADSRGRRRALLSRLHAKAPLRRAGMVHLGEPQQGPLSARFVGVGELVVSWLDGREYWPEALNGAASWVAPSPRTSCPLAAAIDRALAWDGERSELDGRAASPSRPDGAGTDSCARTGFVAVGGPAARTNLEAVAAWAQAPVLHVWNRAALPQAATLARLHGASIFVESGRRWADWTEALSAIEGLPVFLDTDLVGDDDLRSSLSPLFEVRLPALALSEQIALWRKHLEGAGLTPFSDSVLRTRVCDMALGAADIRRTVQRAAWQSWVEGEELRPETLRAMATSNLNQGMYAVADRIPTTLGWNDVVLPDLVMSQLMELITYARYQTQVFDEWGFGAKVPYGRANSSLFYGAPGTGKTMMAGIIARELGMDLFRVDMSRVVSKFIGETEKNLARVFDEASKGHAVLLFDEADSLFAKRTEVKSSHDRYANLEVNYLLQRIEMFEGITILTTNFRDNIDPAFARRLRFKVEFPKPEAGERTLLWQRMLPRAAHVAERIDFAGLGKEYELCGAHIKDAVLRAAFTAAEAGGEIDTPGLHDAAVAVSRELGHLVRVRFAS